MTTTAESRRVSATLEPDHMERLEAYRQRVYLKTGARLSISACAAIMISRGLDVEQVD